MLTHSCTTVLSLKAFADLTRQQALVSCHVESHFENAFVLTDSDQTKREFSLNQNWTGGR